MPVAPSPGSIDDLWRLVQQRYGIVVPVERRRSILGELESHSAVLGCADLDELCERVLQHDPPAVDFLLTAVTVNHTGFFREMAAYRVFLEELLPSLERMRGEVRVWSAACSSGEELYTLVMLLADRLGLGSLRSRWRFLGTDINAMTVSRAEAGLYYTHDMEQLPPEFRRRYFEPINGGRARIGRELRSLCTFRRLNLLHRPLPFQQPFHVILCRNVLYYFDERDQRLVLSTLYDAADEGSWLLTGVSDSVRLLGSSWRSESSILHRRASEAP